jgi:hypothetical protein
MISAPSGTAPATVTDRIRSPSTRTTASAIGGLPVPSITVAPTIAFRAMIRDNSLRV